MTPETSTSLGLSVKLPIDYETALARVTAALKTEGFGVVTEIDVKATLKTKLDVDFRPYKILGACNPPLAYRALQAAPQIGLLLPCNVTVSQEEDHCLVSLVDPISMMDFVQNPALVPIAEEARARLERVAAALAA
ncbi:MAG: DUF302 domain-containing protein [Anaerolineales bacterium]|nr:DUF302 domain-containing protein [Anaerolineales bacterium]